jgi:hypothetical protein
VASGRGSAAPTTEAIDESAASACGPLRFCLRGPLEREFVEMSAVPPAPQLLCKYCNGNEVWEWTWVDDLGSESLPRSAPGD